MTTGPDHTPLIDEQLSAWLDDELPREELELLTTRLARSPEYQARLARYSLISGSLRGGLSGGGDAGTLSTGLAALQLAGRVRIALDGPAGPEQHPEQHPETARKSRVLPYAVAAGLALVAVAFAALQGPLWRPGVDQVAGSAVVDRLQASAKRPGTAGQASLSPQRLTNYLVYHGEYSGLLSARVNESHIVNSRPYAVALRTADRSPTQ